MSEEKVVQTTPEKTEEPEVVKKLTIQIQGPLGESDEFMINTKESVYGLKQRLETNFAFSSYTNYHFLYKNGEEYYSINSDNVTFESLGDVKEGSLFYLINDPYDARSIKHHISHFIGILTHKVPLIGQLLKYQNDDLPDVLQKLQTKIDEATIKIEKGEEVEKTSFEEIKCSSEELESDTKLASFVQKQLLPNNIYFKNFLDVHDILDKHNGQHEENNFVNRCVLDVWNPPKQSRKLVGDLIYLQVTTKENMILHITGCADGFYINQSTDSVFNANISSIYSDIYPTLCGLFLIVSPAFRTIFSQRNSIHKNNKIDLEELFSSLNVLPANQEKAAKWFDTEDRKVEPLDFFSEMSRFGSIECLEDTNKPYVDWQKDYIAVRDIDFDENTRICCILEKENSFAVAAKEGVKTIVDDGAAPLNSLGGETPAYIVNGIFFSTVLDKPEYPINRTTSNDEICSVRGINQSDINGLNTLLSCVIDYKGRRYLAQGLIPGLLQKNTNKMLVSGTLDDGRTIYHDDRVQKYIEDLSKDFFWKPSTVYVQKSEEEAPAEEPVNAFDSPYATEAIAKTVDEAVPYTGPLDGRIVKGCDDKLYIMDYIRSQPLDILWKQDCYIKSGAEGAVANRILRRELVQHWAFRRTVMEAQIDLIKKNTEEIEKKETKTEEDAKQLKEYAEQLPKLEELIKEMPSTFDVNAFTIFNKNTERRAELTKENSELKTTETESDVIVLNNFLRTEIIPAFVQQVLEGSIPCEDGDKLTANMHANGINMRYLGSICDILEKLKESKAFDPSHFEFLCESEMIARASKHILIDLLTHPILSVAPGYVVAAYFNALVKKNKESSDILLEGLRKKKSKSNIYIPADIADTLTNCCVSPAGVWDLLKIKIQSLYHYELHYFNDKDNTMNVSETERLSVIRRICQLVGITIRAIAYNVNNEYTFNIEDILSFHPRIKPAVTPIISIRAQELYQQAEESLSNMNFIGAYKLYNVIIINLLTTYGLLHPLVIRCLTSMASILYSLRDYKGAIKYQRLALQCSDRLQGADSLDSALLHAGLSTYLTKAGAVFEAFLHCRLALDSYIVSSGLYSEESLVLLIKYAICYRNCGLVEKSLALFATIFQHLDKNSVNYALALRECSLSYVVKKDFINAIKYEKQYNEFYTKRNNDEEKKLITISKQLIADYEKELKH